MRIMVLNDGQTYTDVGGCHIVETPNLDADELEVRLDEFMRSDAADDGEFRIICGFTENGERIDY